MQLVCTRPTCNPGLTSLTDNLNYELINSKMMKTILKSFFVLLAMLMSQVAWAALEYEAPVVYDFATAAINGGTITMSSKGYPSRITAASYAASMNSNGNTEDISRFAFRYTGPLETPGDERGWYLRNNTSHGPNEKGLFCKGTNYTPELAICDLRAGDKITINYVGANITFKEGAHGYNGSSLGVLTDITSGTEITVSQDGDMIIKANDNFTYINTIKIEALKSIATYSLTTNVNNNTRSTTFAFTGEGRMEDNIVSVPFMEVQFGSNQNVPIVEGLGGDTSYPVAHIPDWNGYWHIWFNNSNFNIPAQGTFYKFKPTAKGKLQVKGHLSGGSIYLYAVDETTGKFNKVADPSNTGTGTISIPSGWVTLEKGKTYFLCEDPNNTSQNAFLLHEFTYTNDFNIMELGKVLDNGASEGVLASVRGASKLDKYTIKASGNINTENVDVTFSGDNNGGTLSISGISYNDNNADKAGVIILNLEFDGGNATFVVTIPYSAEKGHIWNFSDTRKSDSKGTNTNGLLEIGRYADTGSTLYNETQAGDWKFTHRVINQSGQGTHDPMFKNTRDMDGNNAAMIWETEGLWFTTPSNKSCIYNESMGTETFTVTLKDSKGNIRTNSDGTQMTEERRSDPDRYVGILPGGKFTIPGLKEGDRVIIFMGSGDGSNADVCFFNISNAKDAIGQDITETDVYKAGGSLWNVDNNAYNGHNDPNYRGCYHFIAQDDGPMTFEMVGGSMCKLYSIEIYRGERINTNSVQEGAKGSGYTLLATKDGGAGETKTWNLHYRGKGETLADGIERDGKTIKNEFIAWSGTITKENTPLTTNSNTISCTNNGVIGMARVRAKCMEYNQKYVTDFADRNLTFAYHEKAPEYPYTWDFTDINGFSISAITGEYNNYNELQSGDDGYEFEPKGRELSMWDANGKMVIYCSDGSYYQNQNMIFENAKGINGNQLYANGAVIPETKGLWFYFDNNDPAYNGCMQIAADGLHLANTKKMMEDGTTNLTMGWWNYKMVIPDVPAGAAVYLRMQRDPSVADGDFSQKPNEDPVYFLNTSYHFGVSSTSSPKTSLTPVNSSSFDLSKQADVYNATGNRNSKYSFYKVNGKTDEWIACVKNTTGAVNNLTFTLNGWTLKKLAVSEDAKTVNKLGWNTESRERAIDPSLTAYMTGKDFRTYIVTGVSEENKTATLARIDGGSGDDLENTKGKLFVPAATDGSINACIIRNADGEAVDLFGTNSGFHLFVPDMRDDATAKSTSLAGNLLKARVTATSDNNKVPRTENGNNNYAFTFKYKKVDENGDAYTEAQEGVQAFYRIVNGGAKSGGNQAYLSIPQVIASSRAAVRAEEAAATPESYTLVFKDWYDLEGEKGDVNGDGLVNEADMELAKDYVTVRKSNGLFKRMGDMNDDGNVDIVDLTLLIKKIMSE